MKRIILPIMAIFCFFIYVSPLLATPRTTTITWTMPGSTNIQEYRIYYDNSETMANMVLLNNHSTIEEYPDRTFTVSCYNVEMEDNATYYFTVSALMMDGTEIFSIPYEAIFTSTSRTITPVQNFRVSAASNDNALINLSGNESNGSLLTNNTGVLVLSAGVTHITDHSGSNNSAFDIQGTNHVAFPCYNGINFYNHIGHIDFWYQCTSTPATYGRFFAHSSQDFSLQRHGTDTNISVSWNDDQSFYVFSNVVNVFDGTWHHIIFRWSLATKNTELDIDTNTYTANIPMMTWNLAQGMLYLGNRSTDDRNIGGAIDDLSIYDTY